MNTTVEVIYRQAQFVLDKFSAAGQLSSVFHCTYNCLEFFIKFWTVLEQVMNSEFILINC